MPIYTDALRPFLFRCDPEWVHDRSLQVGKWVGNIGPLREALAAFYHFEDERLRTEVGGIAFPNPVGLAAGYDKNGRVIPLMEALGFGFVEIGSVSADSSPGNPRPRLWRLPADRGICVHYGLPNDGAEAIAARLVRTRRTVPLAINLVKTNRGINAPPDPDEAIIEDYLQSIRLLKAQADMLCLNLSCPNTEMGRDVFCDSANIGRLVSALAGVEVGCPVFLKVPPLSGPEGADRLLEAVADSPVIAGFVFNLPPGLPEGLRTPSGRLAAIQGAVSGKPVEDRINASICALYRRMDRRRYQIIGVGGIFSAEDAYAKIRLGASLVQLLTGLIYEGPGLIARIKRGLCRLLERDGFASIGEAVGTAHSG